MKQNLLAMFAPALLLGFMTCGVVACGNDDDDDVKPGTEQPVDGGKDDGKDDHTPDAPQQDKVVVKVDKGNNASDGHRFVAVSTYNYMIDDIMYTARDGYLWVIGYDKEHFKGDAKLIDALEYRGEYLELRGIKEWAFMSCRNLTSVTIPSSVTSIGDRAFVDCIYLTAVHISDLNAWCRISFGSTSDSNPLTYAHRLYLNGKKVTEAVFPDGITSIGKTFMGCWSLTSVTLPGSATSIEDEAFRDCQSLTSVTIPDGVTSIGKRAFENCAGLATVTIPGSVSSIGVFVFLYCTNLMDVYCYAAAPPSDCDGSPFLFTSAKIATLHVPAGSVDAYKSDSSWNCFGSIVAIE